MNKEDLSYKMKEQLSFIGEKEMNLIQKVKVKRKRKAKVLPVGEQLDLFEVSKMTEV